MNIESLKVKPQLVEFTIDDADIVSTYGETITFWMYDHLDLTTYFNFFRAQSKQDTDELLDVIRSIIRDSSGKPVLSKEDQLPVDIFTAAVVGIAKHLGKSETKNSTSVEAGTQP